jgi:hypothetical protein
VDIIFILKIAATLLGLTIPGYALARLLRLQHAHFAAFPLSALMIYQAVTAVTLLNGRITLFAISAILAGITTLCGLPHFSASGPADNAITANNDEPAPAWWQLALAATSLLLLAAAFRATLYPLAGFDTFTRWDGLAREMLQYGSLSFYPPVTAADFSIYPLPDGFPPLVASVYWWIYAATGETMPQLTAISVTLQLVSILGLCWSAAAKIFGRKAAAFTLLVLVASPLLARSVLIGQESGFLALAVAGQICFALAASRTPSLRPVIAAALFASIGAVAREYGPALALPGFVILILAPATRRYAWKYALIAALLSAPWYIRNWLIAGSPLYPLFLPGSPRANGLLAALVRYYGEIFGLSRFGTSEWLSIVYELFGGCSLALAAALPCLLKNGRRLLPYSLSLALVTILWLWSVGKTSGGVVYSMRVLAPAVVVLAICAGEFLRQLTDERRWKYLPWLLVPSALWGLLSVLAFPLAPDQLSQAFSSTKGELPEFCEGHRMFAGSIDRLGIPATGILTDSPYLAVILKRETRFRPVILWSSEVSFMANPQIGSRESRQKLLDLNIRLVAVNISSVHNEFLSRIPFYRDDPAAWRQLPTNGQDWALFELPATPQVK